MELEWYSIPDGKTFGSLGAGIGRDYLIHLHEVASDEHRTETTESVAKRLTDMRGHEGTNDPSEAVRSAPMDSQTTSSKGDTVTDTDSGLLKDESAGRGAALAHGDRQKAYGHPKVSFDRIATFWSTYLTAPQIDPANLSAEDVGHMMNLLKISRTITDKSADSIDDIEGYITCIRMIRQYEAETE
jgi:hypothetical protein